MGGAASEVDLRVLLLALAASSIALKGLNDHFVA